jgi:acyl carrier protein
MGGDSVIETERQVLEESVLAVVAEVINRPRAGLTLDADLIDEFQVDSLDALDIALKLEQVFGIQVADERLGEFRVVRRIVEAVAEALDARAECPAAVGDAH